MERERLAGVVKQSRASIVKMFRRRRIRSQPAPGLGVYSEAHWTGVGDGGGYRELAAEGPSARKILVLISDTGGGHRASAQAIEAACGGTGATRSRSSTC